MGKFSCKYANKPCSAGDCLAFSLKESGSLHVSWLLSIACASSFCEGGFTWGVGWSAHCFPKALLDKSERWNKTVYQQIILHSCANLCWESTVSPLLWTSLHRPEATSSGCARPQRPRLERPKRPMNIPEDPSRVLILFLLYSLGKPYWALNGRL